MLLHPTSLPGEYGIGTLGKHALEFVDFLAASAQKMWQMCPLGPTGYGNSPYQCFSAFAGNPLLIDLDDLVERRLLGADDLLTVPQLPADRVDYPAVIASKIPLLKKAAAGLASSEDAGVQESLERFAADNSDWLDGSC